MSILFTQQFSILDDQANKAFHDNAINNPELHWNNLLEVIFDNNLVWEFNIVLSFQKLEGKIENISCKDLVDLPSQLYFKILQKLKEKAIELEDMIEKRNSQIDADESFENLEKILIKVKIHGNINNLWI